MSINQEQIEGAGEQPGAEIRLQDKQVSSSAPATKKYANLRDDSIFRPFSTLPDDQSIDLELYTTSDGSVYTFQKHWCFLAEITDVEFILRLKLTARDASGTTVPVAFHTEGRGSEFLSGVEPGHTIVVLYAHQHGFLDFTTGIRLDEGSNEVKILPISLPKLLRLNDRVHQYCTEINGDRICHACDKRKPNLQKCGKCSLFWYCDKTCQMAGWAKNDHKQDCKILRDSDLQAMFLLNWSDYTNAVKFPMEK